MGPSPSVFLKQTSLKEIQKTFSCFRHRFTKDQELCAMLFGLKEILRNYGTLQACFLAELKEEDDTVLPALSAFTAKLSAFTKEDLKHFVPSPARGSACKRLNLFLRWMVRFDDVDPGGWNSIPVSKLIVPVDTHMHRICLLLGLTARKHANMTTAMEITKAFRAIVPEDPVKYDFSLTRLGIRKDLNIAEFVRQLTCLESRPHLS
jgi:uncharacterized protein (TIGR02757 family)